MKKFFNKGYFRNQFSTVGIRSTGGSLWEMEKFGEKILRKVVPLFFGSNFWGKKFMTNCSPYIAKNPRGPAGEGVQGEYRGEYWGHIPWFA